MKTIFAFLLCAASLAAQTVSQVSVNVNVQVLSAAAVKAKYGLALPKGMSAGSVVAENKTASTIVIGQGSILAALRDQNYPALSRTDAAAAILHSQQSGILGKIRNLAPTGSKMLDDVEGLIVSGAIKVSPGVGTAIAGAATVAAKLAPDVAAAIAQFQATYDSDGLQNLLQLAPGQSAVGTVIFDTPGKGVTAPPASFSVPVLVTGVPTAPLQAR